MKLSLECGSARKAEPIIDALRTAGVPVGDSVVDKTWPDWLALHATGDLDFNLLRLAVTTLAQSLCPDNVTVAVRIVRESALVDLLYQVPCDDYERASGGLGEDVRSYTDKQDAFRSWFRGQWMGQQDENRLTAEELSSAPLTAARMLAYLDPPTFRDWRPIQHFIESHGRCSDLVEAMAAATSATQKWRLAYVFHRRRRSCESAIPILIGWLRDADRRVREEAANAVADVVLNVRTRALRHEWSRKAGEALLSYAVGNPEDDLYSARTGLGALGFEPARQYLEDVARTSSGQRRESAERGVSNLNEAKSYRE